MFYALSALLSSCLATLMFVLCLVVLMVVPTLFLITVFVSEHFQAEVAAIGILVLFLDPSGPVSAVG
jgi:choline-glycine betaine transporter